MIVILILVPGFLLLILYASITDYHPEKKELLSGTGNQADILPDSIDLGLLIWNIGYGGLDKDMDFFYDGGAKVRTPEEQLKLNYSAISDFLQTRDSIDMFLLQEVDVISKRSYRFNEVDSLSETLKKFSSFYGKNYDVFFVPVPLTKPMGGVNSGLLSFSRYNPSEVERFSFPGQYAWPKRLFMLDRCFLVMRFQVQNGKELLVINTHNEAYDDGSIRDRQMVYLKEFLTAEYNKGNYIVVGGDWNQCPPGFQPQFPGEVFDTINNKGIENDFITPNWHWEYDATIPSNRRIDVPYSKGKTMTTVIDFFLLSPNIQPLVVRTIDLQFENSDHQPVYMRFSIK